MHGGFGMPTVARFRPGWPAWLRAGGVLVLANLRGGGEFGSDWYAAGRGPNKPRVFEDLIAVAEDLVAGSVTTAAQLAMFGHGAGAR